MEFEPPKLDWECDDLASQWTKYKRNCQTIFNTFWETKDEKVKAGAIQYWLGDRGAEIIAAAKLTAAKQAKLADVTAVLDAYFDARTSFRCSRFELHDIKQQKGESIDKFVTRLKLAAQKCKFGDSENDRIIDYMIFGVNNYRVRRELMGKDEKLTLDDAITAARLVEASSRDADMFENHTDSSNQTSHQSSQIDALSRQIDALSMQKGSTKHPCDYCGYRYHRVEGKCPARGHRCQVCGQYDHYERVCRAKSSLGSRKPVGQYQNQRQQQKPPYYPSRKFVSGKGPERGQTSRIHAVDQDTQQDYMDNYDPEEMYYDEMHMEDPGYPPDQVLYFNSIRIDSSYEKPGKTEAFARLEAKIPGRSQVTDIKAKIDTGAQGNVLPIRIYKQLFPKNVKNDRIIRPLPASRIKLYAYNDIEIKQFGICTIPCTFRDINKNIRFFVADVAGPTIIGLPDSQALDLVRLDCSIATTSIKPEVSPLDTQQKVTEPTTSPKVTTTLTKDTLKATYPDRFSGIGKFKEEYHIDIDPSIRPVHQRARSVPIHVCDPVKAELDEMLQSNVIVPEDKPTKWLSSLTYSQKPSGRWRVCLDPTQLNRAIRRTYHHTPTIEEITHKLRGAKVFSHLDARHGYWAVVLDEESSKLTTFNTPWGRFRYIRLPFGAKCSQDEFQRRMDFILSQCDGAVGIADDVIVFGEDEASHDKNLHQLMLTARKEGLVFNWDKCEIKIPKVLFFGMVYDKTGIHSDPKKVDAIKALDAPTNVDQLHTFLGLATYMSAFIPSMSTLTAPLRELLKKGVQFIWSETHQRSFEAIKSAICEHTALVYYNPNKPATIQVDASMEGLGAALVQEHGVVAFASKSLTDTEKRYANIEREMLAVVFGCERFHYYIYGRHFEVHSDHSPLEKINLKDIRDTPRRLQSMLLRIQNYDMKIKWVPGKKMLLADPLSRLNPVPGQAVQGLDVKVCHIRYIECANGRLREEIATDPTMNMLKETVYNGWPAYHKDCPLPLRPYWEFRDRLSVEDGLVVQSERVVIPEKLRPEMLDRLHEGHLGIEKCRLRAKDSMYWPGIDQQIEQRVNKCLPCQQRQNALPKQPLEPLEVPTRAWQILGGDIFFWNGREFLLTDDYYSKFPVVREILKGQSNSATVVNLLKSVFSEHGKPERYITDNGPHFVSTQFEKFAKEWDFEHVRSSPRYPKSHGFIERQIQTVKNIFDKAHAAGQDIQKALLCFRTTPVDSVLPSPAEMLTNRKFLSNIPQVIRNKDPNAETIVNRLGARQAQMKACHDRFGTQHRAPFLVNQPVFAYNTMSKQWAPGKVCLVHSDRSVSILMDSGVIYRRNTAHVRPNHGNVSQTPVNTNHLVTSHRNVTATSNANNVLNSDVTNVLNVPSHVTGDFDRAQGDNAVSSTQTSQSQSIVSNRPASSTQTSQLQATVSNRPLVIRLAKTNNRGRYGQYTNVTNVQGPSQGSSSIPTGGEKVCNNRVTRSGRKVVAPDKLTY